jgi:Leucine-rich repeat (LRR) protein
LRLRNTNIQIVEYLPEALEELDCFNSKISQIYTLSPNLKNCFLAKNYLTILPSLSIWPQGLRVLDLAFNFLKEFPKWLPDSLEHLNLGNNLIEQVPKRLPINLKILSLRKNRINTVHTELLIRQKIIVFSLADNWLTEVPECIRTAREDNIEHYDLSANFLEDEYDDYAVKIQRAFRYYRMAARLRGWKRTRYLREELLAAAMHPDRYGNFF